MPDIWFIADFHFRHENILKFKDAHGCLLRPEFATVDEMDEYMLSQYNDSVKPNDKAYILGDVTFKHDDKAKNILRQLHGNKTLILGNHDDVSFLYKHLTQKIKLYKKFLDAPTPFIITHMPIRQEEVIKNSLVNVHGHIHEKNVLNDDGTEDMRYFNVGVEQLGYEPIHYDDLQSLISDTPLVNKQIANN